MYRAVSEAATLIDACVTAYTHLARLFTIDRFFCCVVDEEKSIGETTIDFVVFQEGTERISISPRHLDNNEIITQVLVSSENLSNFDKRGQERCLSPEIQGMEIWQLLPLMSSARPSNGILGACRKQRKAFTQEESELLSLAAEALSQVVVQQQAIRDMRLDERKAVIDEVAGSFFHEIVNEFGPIFINLQIMESTLRETSAEYPAHLELYLGTIARQAANLYSRISEQWKQLKTYLYKPVVQSLSILEVIGEACRVIPSGDREVVLHLDSNTPCVRASYRELVDVFRELLRNAHHATQDSRGKKIIVTSGPWHDDQGSEWAKIEIIDSGCGIDSDSLDQIWKLGFSTKHNAGGFGLYWVKNMIEDIHGIIEVKSELNKGTTFTVKLPSADSKKDTLDQEDSCQQQRY